jgi:hypothetical protein
MSLPASRFHTEISVQWTVWDTLNIAERSLEVSGTVLNQISDIGKLTKKSLDPSYRALNRLGRQVDNLTGVLYCFDWTYSASLIYEGRFIDRNDPLNTAARISLFITEILTPLNWFHEQGVLFLGTLADVVGRGISLFEGIGYALWALSDIKTVLETEDASLRIRAIINIIWYALWLVGTVLEAILCPNHIAHLAVSTITFLRHSLSLYDALTSVS